MKNPVFKSKSALFALSAVVVMGLGTLAYGKVQYDISQKTFLTSGKIITTNEQAESIEYQFADNTKYKSGLSNTVIFEDIQDNTVQLEKDNYIFYNDGTISALTKGVLLDIEDVQGDQYINNYNINALSTIASGKNGIGLNNGIEDIYIDEAVWKISEEKYLLLADNMSVKFTDEDERDVENYIVLNYVDAGVVQIITEENIWQTVSTTAYIETDNGAVINLYDQLIEVNGSQMLMSKLIIDADANIEVSPLETLTQALPEFDIRGESGDDGNGGESGVSGTYGSNGSQGGEGDGGSSGSIGETGESGDDALEGSTMTTTIPSVSLTNWKVSATGIDATYSVLDEDSLMTSDLSIAIYETGSGIEYLCVNEFGYSDEFVTHQDLSFMNEESLKPDTEYVLSISGEFELNGTVYREFVSKTFYTDSLGVFINESSVTNNTIELNVEQMEYSLANKILVYLIQEEDNANFDPENTSYEPISIMFDPLSEQNELITFDMDYTFFDGRSLKSNTTYVVRMVMELQGEEHSYLSQQALTINTLKIAPTFSGNAVAISNRSSWSFELYGCTVMDQDNAIQSYVYDVYCAEPSDPNYGKLVRSFNVNTNASDQATQLYIDGETIKTDTKYYFEVRTVYNDNEKIVETVVATSSEFSMTGSQLPSVYFVNDEEESQYESIVGDLYMALNGAQLKIDSANPLYVYVECEGIYEKTIKFENYSTGTLEKYGDDGIRIRLAEYGLNDNKIYRISIKATVDVDDGNGFLQRSLGHVAVVTEEIPVLKTVWSIPSDYSSSNVFVRRLTLSSGGNDNVLVAGSIESQTLSQVNVQLCMASDTEVVLGEIEYVDQNADIYNSDLLTKFTEGIVITEEDFNMTQDELLAEEGYVLRVNAIYDYTKTHPQAGSANVNGYINQFGMEGVNSTVINPNELPPTLPTTGNMGSQITVQPIYNSDAEAYGVTKDTTLFDNTIIGFTLNFGYENSSRLARSVKFYGFEKNKFDAVSNKMDLIYENYKSGDNAGKLNGNLKSTGDWLFNGELSVSKESLYLPKVAVIFGTGTNGYANGHNVMYAPEMERGYVYNFAYAVEYAETQDEDVATYVYPYQYGAFDNFVLADRLKYSLSSKDAAAPKTSPVAYTYIKNQTEAGTEFSYIYFDCEDVVSTGGPLNDSQGRHLGAIGNAGEWIDVTTDKETSNLQRYGIVMSGEIYIDTYSDYSKNTSITAYTPTDNGTKITDTHFADVEFKIDTENENYIRIDFNLEEDPANLTAEEKKVREEVRRKVAGVELEFNPKNGDPVTLHQVLSTDDFSLTLPTTMVEFDELVGKGSIVVSAKLYYDTGYVSWGTYEGDEYVSLQTHDGATLPTLSDYLGYYTGIAGYQTSGYAMGSLVMRSASTGDFKTLTMGNAINTSYTPHLTMVSPTLADGTDTKTVWLAKGKWLFGSSENTTQQINLVAKRVESTNAKNKVTIDEIRAVNPAITVVSTEVYTNTAVLKNVVLSGTNHILEEDGKKFVTVEITNDDTDATTYQVIDITNWTPTSSITLNLEQDTTYTIKVFASVVGDGEVDEIIYLRDADSDIDIEWELEITTAEFIEIVDGGISFSYDSYLEHKMNIWYNINQISAMSIRYSIQDTAGNELISNTELYDNGALSNAISELNYTSAMYDNLTFAPGTTKKLSQGSEYNLVIDVYEYVDSTINSDISLLENSYKIPFTMPYLSDPTVFNNTWVDGTNVYVQFSLNDSNKIIMSDYENKESDAYYYARVYRVEDSTYTDVTPTDSKYTAYKAGTSYTVTIPSYKYGETYQLVLYSTFDSMHNGIHDETVNGQNITTGITKVDNTTFDNNNARFILFEGTPFNTPNPTDISLGTQYLVSASDLVRVEYTLPNKINEITSVEYTIIHSNGNMYSGSLDNASQDLFEEKSGGMYILDLPNSGSMNGSTMCNVTIDYYIGDTLFTRYSGNCYY